MLYSDFFVLCGQKGFDFILKVIGGELILILGILDVFEVCKNKI